MALACSSDLSYISPSLRENDCVASAFSGSPTDQYALANYFLEGSHGFSQNKLRGVYWLTQSMNGGDLQALNQLGLCYLEGEGLMKDEVLGFHLIKLAAEKGDLTAIMNVALLATNGRGTPVNYPLAAEFLQRAAEMGSGIAANQLGQLYLQGWGVPKDHDEAFVYFGQAALAGVVEAHTSLAKCYEEGIGTDVNKQIAKKHLMTASLSGDIEAQRRVGEKHLLGCDGFDFDPDKARRYIIRAANAGDAQAQFILAKCYEKGVGGQQDSVARVKWLEKAAEQHHPEALAELQLLMTEQERASFKGLMSSSDGIEATEADASNTGATNPKRRWSKRRSFLHRLLKKKDKKDATGSAAV